MEIALRFPDQTILFYFNYCCFCKFSLAKYLQQSHLSPAAFSTELSNAVQITIQQNERLGFDLRYTQPKIHLERRGTTAVTEKPHSRRDKQRLWPAARSKTDTMSQLGQYTSRAALDV